MKRKGMKTSKSILKRIKITANKKIIRRSPGQDHFLSKDSGKKVRLKRSLKTVPSDYERKIKELLPYHLL